MTCQLCEACQRLLNGERVEPCSEDGDKWRFRDEPYHDTFESFEAALSLPCSICSMVKSMGKDGKFATKEDWSTPLDSVFAMNPGGNVWRVLLQQRQQGVPSFWVEPLASLLLVKADDPLGAVWNNGVLPVNTGSDAPLEWLYSKYNECLENHPLCRPNAPQKIWYPKRLLELGKQTDDLVRLCDSDQFTNEGPYFTLSHSWGRSEVLTLTKATEQRLRAGTPINDLPKTFQEAIAVCRRFGIRYLWIDSLCIFQDDLADWAAEASRMRDVYSRASCNIAATASYDSNGGLFRDRNPRVACFTRRTRTTIHEHLPPSGSYWLEEDDLWRKYIEDAPLNRRAWVSQERYLSPRIMHFTAAQLFWECKEQLACENHPEGLPFWATLSYRQHSLNWMLRQLRVQDDSSAEEDSALPEESRKALFKTWDKFIMSYSGCGLTKPTDKLVAIQGIIQEVARDLDDESVAGFWKSQIIRGLCWKTGGKRPPSRLPEWRAPTWSWLSADCPVDFNTFNEFFDSACNCSTPWMDKPLLVNLEALEVATKPSGELSHANMKLTCNPIRVNIRGRWAKSKDVRMICGRVRFEDAGRRLLLSWGERRNRFIRFDTQIESSGEEGAEVMIDECYIVFVRWCPDMRAVEAMAEGILLLPTDKERSVFERIGHVLFEDRVAFDIVQAAHEAAVTRIIELV